MILSSGSSSILLNGVPRKPFKCKRGVRQGDTPLLFVVAADLLQSVINNAADNNIFKHPLGGSFGGDYPLIQYADDMLLIMPAKEQQLVNLKGILDTYAASTGLKVNFSKSSLVPINVEQQRANLLAEAIGCTVGTMPFTYLGLPLGTTRPTIEEYMPLMQRIKKKVDGGE